MVETLRREKEEEKERFSLELQRLRVEMREMGNKHRHELMQAEIEHKVGCHDYQSPDVYVYMYICFVVTLIYI